VTSKSPGSSFGRSSASRLSESFISAWRELYEHSETPSAYLSPEFVLTALQTFHSYDPQILSQSGPAGLEVLAVAAPKSALIAFPTRALSLFRTKHSFQSGLLIRKGLSDERLDVFIKTFLALSPCIQVRELDAGSAAGRRLLERAKRVGATWYERDRYERAILDSSITVESWERGIRNKKLSEYRRCHNRLAELGSLEWRLVDGTGIDEKSIEGFLSLEHAGWKGEQGTSMLSDEREARFFRSLVDALRLREEVFFSELRLDDSIVASTVNFRSNGAAFAFKVAWQPELAKYSPGILNEIGFIRHVATNTVPYAYIDSGASGTSFINSLWPERTTMLSGYLLQGLRVKSAAGLVEAARKVKRHIYRTRPENE